LKEAGMKYTGSCHCGNVTFEVEGDLERAVVCNCSICSRKGALMWFVPRASLRLLSEESAAKSYTFNKHAIEHRFCLTCGIQPYAEGNGPAGRDMAAVNIRCLDGVDPEGIPVSRSDGRSL
jgi:hypothetical protein